MSSREEKWNKLRDDYVVVSIQPAAGCHGVTTRLAAFLMNNGKTVFEIQHQFNGLVNECAI